jgi:serine/threonine protein kinase
MQTVGGRYVVDGRLGEGAMGQVYRVRHLSLNKPFALKVIAPAFANDTDARARFNHEAKLASEISHANIVSIVDFGEDPHFGAYMVMELVDGEPLFDEGSAPLSVRRALDVLAQVADALDHLHKRGIVHGDVKAENISIASEVDGAHGARRRRVVRLLDFGLAQVMGATEDGISGSPHYIAPERARGAPASSLTDVYALGVLGFLLFTRTLPFDGPNVVEILTKHIEARPPTLTERRGDPVDDAIEQLIARAMAKDPAARHQSAGAFRYELNNAMDMLDLGRRARKSQPIAVTAPAPAPEVSLLGRLFEESLFAQALMGADGSIVVANRAFASLVGDHAAIGRNFAQLAFARDFPMVLEAVRAAHAESWPVERRAKMTSSMELVVWAVRTTAMHDHVHVIARIAETD